MNNHCPVCKGTGKKLITVSTYGVPGTTATWLNCVVCDGGQNPIGIGTGKFIAQQILNQAELWCSCGSTENGVTYVPDGASQYCHKHHWTCNKCSKILQIG